MKQWVATVELAKFPRILLADDEVIFLRSTKEYLENQEYEVLTATNSEVAFEMLERTDFDLVILDNKMPGNEDFQLVRRMQRHFPDVPVIIITGYPSLNSVGDLFELDVCDYLSKPVNLELLKKRVGRALAQRQLQLALAASYSDLEQRVMERTEELRKANNSLLAEAAERKQLELIVLDTAEREKRRIGRDLHDDLGQTLTAMAYKVKELEMNLPGHSVGEKSLTEEIKGLLKGAIATTKGLSFGLSPVGLENKGIEYALEDLAARCSTIFDVACEFSCPAPISKCSNDVAVSLFRIAQEAITNAIKHGRPATVLVCLAVDQTQLTLSVIDDGAGIPENFVSKTGMGIKTMRARARTIGAHLTVRGNKKKGTAVVCSLTLTE